MIIDRRVVEMRFDNSAFEKNVATSLGTINGLKQALNFSGAAKGFDDISNAAGKVNMGALSTGIAQVQASFSAMEVMAITALANITNRAVDAGIGIAKALTIEPVFTGLNEYETKLNAIQTILTNTASKGTTIDDVTLALDTLNTYADKTIYNFAEMTRNIGTFTAAGIDLETSTSAIQGIANLAAASGSNAQQASTAMYQLSQALSTGTVRLLDWNSVVNAGMGGELFRTAILDTATEMGVAVDHIVDGSVSFRDSLQENWLSADILNTTLIKFTKDGAAKYAQAMVDSGKYTEEQAKALLEQSEMMEDAATKVKTFTQLWTVLKETAQSGWAKTWELLIGDFYEARNFFTELSDIFGGLINESAETRNNILESWSNMGGRDMFTNSIFNVIEAIGSVVKPIKDAFDSIFPAISSIDLLRITKDIEIFTAKLKLSDEASANLKITFEGLFSVIGATTKVIQQGLTIAFNTFQKIVSVVGDDFLEFTASLGNSLKRVSEFMNSNIDLQIVLDDLGTIFKNVTTLISKWFESFDLLPKIEADFTNFANAFSNFLAYISFDIGNVRNATDQLVETFKDMGTFDFAQVEFSWNVFATSIKNSITGVVSTFTGFQFDTKNAMTGFYEHIIYYLSQTKVVFSNFTSFLSDNLGSIVVILTSAGILQFLRTVSQFLNSFDNLIDMVAGTVKAFNGVLTGFKNVLNAYALEVKSKALMNTSIAIGILVASVIALTLVDTSKLDNALATLAALGIGLLAFMVAMDKVGAVSKASGGINAGIVIALAASIYILSLALEKISDINKDEILENLAVLGTLATGLVAVTAILSKAAPKISTGSLALVFVAFALNNLVRTLGMIADIDTDGVAKNLPVLIGALVVLGGLAVAASNLKLGSSIGLLAIPAALYLMVKSIESLANIDSHTILKNMDALTNVFLAFAVLMALTYLSGKNAISAGISLMAMSTAIIIIVGAMKLMSGINPTDIYRSIEVIEKILFMFALLIASTHLAGANAIRAGTMLMFMSTSLLILSGAMLVMSTVDTGKLEAATDALSQIMVMFGLVIASTNLAKDAHKTMTIISTSILILAISLAVLSLIDTTKLDSAAKALTMVFAALSIVVASTKLLTDAKLTLIILGAVIISLTAALYMLASLPNDTALEAASALSLVLLSISGAMLILSKTGDVSLRALISLGIMVFVISQLGNAILLLASVDAENSIASAVSLSILIGALSGSLILLGIAGKLGGAALLGIGILIALIGSMALLVGGIGALVTQVPMLETFLDKGIVVLEKIGNGIGAFFGGIIGGGIIAASDALPTLGYNLSKFTEALDPFIASVKTLDDSAIQGITVLIDMLMALTGANFLSSITGFITGDADLEQLGEQLKDFARDLIVFSNNIEAVNVENLNVASNAMIAIAEMIKHAPKEGGVLEFFTGTSDLSKLGEQLADFGPHLNTFAKEVKGLSKDDVLKATDAGIAVMEMASKVPNTGGIAGWLFGENGLNAFGNELVGFGPKFVTYTDITKNLSIADVENSMDALDRVIQTVKEIPNTGGVAAWLFGDNGISAFGAELLSFGLTFPMYVFSTKSITKDSVENSMDALDRVLESVENLPKTNAGLIALWSGSSSLSKFGEELADFGPNLKFFADSVKDITTTGVYKAAYAARTVIDIANDIPVPGNLLEWITGQGSLSAFGKELFWFGPYVAAFASSVSGIDVSGVDKAAYAARKVMDIADGVPAPVNIFDWLTGNGTLSGFANELSKFGPAIAAYCTSVANLETSGIDTSIIVASKMIELAAHVPEGKGIVGKITGDNSLSGFANELKAFGPAIAAYCNSVAGVNTSSVDESISIAQKLIELANNAPTNSGIVGKITGDNSLSVFASELEDLGPGMKAYYDSVSELDSSKVDSALSIATSLFELRSSLGTEYFWDGKVSLKDLGDEIKDLGTDLLLYYNKVSIIDTTILSGIRKELIGFSELFTAINEMDTSNVEGFTSSIAMLGSISTEAFTSELSLSKTVLLEGAKTLMDQFIAGLNFKRPSLTIAFGEILDLLLTVISGEELSFYQQGSSIMTQFSAGIKAEATAVSNAFKTTLNTANTTINDYRDAFRRAGVRLVDGFIEGIEDNIEAAARAAAAMAQAASQAANDALDINSPSRVGRSTGSNYSSSVILGILDNLTLAADAGTTLATKMSDSVRTAFSKVQDLVDKDMVYEPVIRPLLDTHNLNGISALNASFNQSQASSIASYSRSPSDAQEIQNELSNDSKSNGTTINYQQNNYSPKALSRAEIYRQTKNQLSVMKGV